MTSLITTVPATDVNIFELASRRKFRYDTPAGQLCTEQLWDLPLEDAGDGAASLDAVALSLASQLRDLKAPVQESFVHPLGGDWETYLVRKLEVVRAVIACLLAERQAASTSS